LVKIAVLLLPVLFWWGCASEPRPRTPEAVTHLTETVTNAPAWRPSTNSLIQWPIEAAPLPMQTVVVADLPAVVVQAPAPFTTAVIETNKWVPWESWCLSNGVGRPHPTTPNARNSYVLATTNGPITLTVGSRVAQWNGLDCWLGFAPQLKNGQPNINLLDARKNLLPLLSPLSASALSNHVIVIDPGHGGRSVGAKNIVSGYYEKDYTLDWARRMQKAFAARGWTVILTRTNDVDLTLDQRLQVADQARAALFISLHFNSAAPSKAQSGLETYCLTPAGMPSSLTRSYEDDPRQVFPNNSFDAQNIQLAAQIHRQLIHAAGCLDRGVRRARFMAVLRGQTRPAVLIEGGFLSNPREGQLIAEGAYRQKMAEAVARSLEMPVLNVAGVKHSGQEITPALILFK
jgi:N-acetylmuramoyl-L-alanine amidase